MKKTIVETAKVLGLGLVFVALIFGVFALCSVMPELLEWTEREFGSLTTWSLILAAGLGLAAWCVKKSND